MVVFGCMFSLCWLACLLLSSPYSKSILASAANSAPSITKPNEYCKDLTSALSLTSCIDGHRGLNVLVVPQNFPHPSLHGSDKRVFHVIEALVGLGHSVSVVPFARTTAKLTEFDHFLLGELGTVTFPGNKKPLLTSADPSESFVHTLQMVKPDVIIMWLWFWDHKFTAPNLFGNATAEYCLQRRQGGRHCRYLVFTDDAHSSRQLQLASTQRDKGSAVRGKQRALKIGARELQAYLQADGVVAITRTDQRLIRGMDQTLVDKASESVVRHSITARVSTVRFVGSSWEQLRSGDVASNASPATAGDAGSGLEAACTEPATTVLALPGFHQRKGLVFVGNGKNPTNVQALRWFLREVAGPLNEAIHRREHELAAAARTAGDGADTSHGHDHFHDPRDGAGAAEAVVRLTVVGGYWDPSSLVDLPPPPATGSGTGDVKGKGSRRGKGKGGRRRVGVGADDAGGAGADAEEGGSASASTSVSAPPEHDEQLALVQRYLHFTGYSAETDMLCLVDTSRVFVSPIVVSTGINTKNVLALSRGVPLVTTVAGAAGMCAECDALKEREQLGHQSRQGGSSYNMTHNVPFFIAPSAEALVASIVEAYLDESTWSQYHNAAVRHASWFGKEAAATELDAVLFGTGETARK